VLREEIADGAHVRRATQRAGLEGAHALDVEHLARLREHLARGEGTDGPQATGRLHGEDGRDGAPERTGRREGTEIGGETGTSTRIEPADRQRARQGAAVRHATRTEEARRAEREGCDSPCDAV
jgi:hypothetical protein